MMMMGADFPGGRVIGATDSNQLPLPINTTTLEVDAAGEVLTPAHIHAALRQLAGFEDHPYTAGADVGDWLPLFV